MFGPMAKWVAQIDEVERIPELIARAFHVATSRPARAGRARAARGHARRGGRRRRRGAVRADAAAPGRGDLARCARCCRAPQRPLVIVGGAAGARRPHATSPRGARRAGCRSPRRSAARTTSTTDSPAYAGHLTLGQDPALAPACGTPTCCSSSATGSARSRRAATRCSSRRARGRRSSTSTPTRPSSAACTRRSSRSPRARPQFAAALRARCRRSTAPRGRTRRAAARADYLDEPGATRPRPGELDLGEVMAHPARAAARRRRSSRTAPATSPSGRTASTSSRATRPARADERRDGLRRAGGGRREARSTPSGPWSALAGDGGFLMSAAGAGDGRAVRAAAIVVLVVNNGMYGTIRMHQERHYPGRVSRHRARQPGLRRARAGVRRARRGGRADRGRSRRRSSARSRPGGRRCSTCASTPRRSTRGRRSARSASRRSRSRRIIPSPPSATYTGASDGQVLCQHRDQRVARRGVGAHPRLQRPRHMAQRPRHRRARSRTARPATRSAPSAASRSGTAPTSARSCSRTPTRSARTHTTSRRRRSTSTTTAPPFASCRSPTAEGVRRVVDDVRLRPRPAGPLDGLLRDQVFQGGFEALKAHFAGEGRE